MSFSLRRVSEGGLVLGDLRPGCWRYLSKNEVALLKMI
jgi:16S rRNA U516 pseudouridylate synthase RsuA-like enzyme